MGLRNKSPYRWVMLIIWSVFPVNTFGGTVTLTPDGEIKGTDSSPPHVSATEFSSVPTPRPRPVEKEEPKLSRAVRDLLTDPPQNQYELMNTISDLSKEDRESVLDLVRKKIERGSQDSEVLEYLRLMEAFLENGEFLRDPKKFPKETDLQEVRKALLKEAESAKSSEKRAIAKAGAAAIQWEQIRRDLEKNPDLTKMALENGGIKAVRLVGSGRGEPGREITFKGSEKKLIQLGSPSGQEMVSSALIAYGAVNTIRVGLTEGIPFLLKEMRTAALFGAGSGAVVETGRGIDGLWRGEINSWDSASRFGREAAVNIGTSTLMTPVIGPGIKANSALQAAAVPYYTAEGLSQSVALWNEGRPFTALANLGGTLGVDTYLLGRLSPRPGGSGLGTSEQSFGPGSAVPDSPQGTRTPSGVQASPDGPITVGRDRSSHTQTVSVEAGRAPEAATTRLAATAEFPTGSVTTTAAIQQPFAPDPFVPVGVLRGSARALNHGPGWEGASLSETVKRVAGESPKITEEAGKTIFTNPQNGRRVIYDRGGDYFRVQDPLNPSSRNFLDPEGNPVNPNKKIIKPNGRVVESGKSNDEYQRESHYRNDDSGAQTRKLLRRY